MQNDNTEFCRIGFDWVCYFRVTRFKCIQPIKVYVFEFGRNVSAYHTKDVNTIFALGG
jgi:hypothetical protein